MKGGMGWEVALRGSGMRDMGWEVGGGRWEAGGMHEHFDSVRLCKELILQKHVFASFKIQFLLQQHTTCL